MSEKEQGMDNQIESVIKTAMSSLKAIVDVNTVIGQPYTLMDGKVIIPVSKVTMGFLAGGGEYSAGEKAIDAIRKPNFPFAGGSGAYVQLSPIGFLVGTGEELKAISMGQSANAYEKIMESASDLIMKILKK